MIVIDASYAFDLCIGEESSRALLETIAESGSALAAPELLTLELMQTMRKRLLSKNITADQAAKAFENYDALSIELYGHEMLRDRIWALRDNLTAYDAAYFALAERLGAPLWTRDRKFVGLPGHAVDVRVF